MKMEYIWLGVAAFIVVFGTAAAYSIAFIPKARYPRRSFVDFDKTLRYDEARNKLRQTIIQMAVGSGFLLSFVAAVIGHNISLIESERRKQTDELTAYLSSRNLEFQMRMVILERLARMNPEIYHDIAYTEIIDMISENYSQECGQEKGKSIATAALIRLANRSKSHDISLDLMLERKCLTGARLDRSPETPLGGGLQYANLSGADVYAADFSRVDLTGAFLAGVNGCDSAIPGWEDDVNGRKGGTNTVLDLRDKGVDGAPKYRELRRKYTLHFVESKLNGVHFDGAGLCGADFQRADLSGAVLDRANISRADFRGSNITPNQLKSSCYGRLDFEEMEGFPKFDNDNIFKGIIRRC